MQLPEVAHDVQLAVLRQLARVGTVDQRTTASMCPGSDGRDMVLALQTLLDQGYVRGSLEPYELVQGARAGGMTLTEKGRDRLREADT